MIFSLFLSFFVEIHEKFKLFVDLFQVLYYFWIFLNNFLDFKNYFLDFFALFFTNFLNSTPQIFQSQLLLHLLIRSMIHLLTIVVLFFIYVTNNLSSIASKFDQSIDVFL